MMKKQHGTIMERNCHFYLWCFQEFRSNNQYRAAQIIFKKGTQIYHFLFIQCLLIGAQPYFHKGHPISIQNIITNRHETHNNQSGQNQSSMARIKFTNNFESWFISRYRLLFYKISDQPAPWVQTIDYSKYQNHFTSIQILINIRLTSGIIKSTAKLMSQSFSDKYGKPFIIGSMSGSIASAVIQPIDTVKVVIQARRQAAGKGVAVTNPFAVAKDVIANDGVIGLYKGVDSAILRQFIYCGIRLGLYKSFQDHTKQQHGRNMTFGEKVMYSLLSGGIGSAIATPTDVSLIRFQSDNNLPKNQRRNYKNVIDALQTIAREEGIRGLWTGAVPTIARASVLNCAHLVAYNQAKQEIMHKLGHKEETISVRLISSAISGIVTACMSLPFDNVKTKIMKMKVGPDGTKPYAGFIDCFRKSIANEGIKGLWVGLPTYYSRIAPHAMITVLLQDFFHDIFTSKKNAA